MAQYLKGRPFHSYTRWMTAMGFETVSFWGFNSVFSWPCFWNHRSWIQFRVHLPERNDRSSSALTQSLPKSKRHQWPIFPEQNSNPLRTMSRFNILKRNGNCTHQLLYKSPLFVLWSHCCIFMDFISYESYVLLVGSLFNDAFSVTRIYSVGVRIREWWWIGKDLVGCGRGLMLRYYPGIRL
jgi:hypothetical protein